MTGHGRAEPGYVSHFFLAQSKQRHPSMLTLRRQIHISRSETGCLVALGAVYLLRLLLAKETICFSYGYINGIALA
jgi:hypothetical protein